MKQSVKIMTFEEMIGLHLILDGELPLNNEYFVPTDDFILTDIEVPNHIKYLVIFATAIQQALDNDQDTITLFNTFRMKNINVGHKEKILSIVITSLVLMIEKYLETGKLFFAADTKNFTFALDKNWNLYITSKEMSPQQTFQAPTSDTIQ